MKKIFIIIFILLSEICIGQDCQYKISNIVYSGCVSLKYKNPSFIRYKLYKGGGDCPRKGMYFRDTTFGSNTKDYEHSGYDKGHLVNAEDFAYDCYKENITFYYYNSIPQYPNLNRGIWKKDETYIRNLSQNDSLLIICGPGYGLNPKKIGTGLCVPDFCWKYVKSLSSNKIIFCRYYTNKIKDNLYIDYSKEEFEKIIGFILK